jgi:hypothetical protein
LELNESTLLMPPTTSPNDGAIRRSSRAAVAAQKNATIAKFERVVFIHWQKTNDVERHMANDWTHKRLQTCLR